MDSTLPGLGPVVQEPRALDELVAEAAEIVAAAKAEHQPTRTFVLFSGGNDSLVLLDAVATLADEVVHVNTGIGIPETTEFARRVGSSYRLPFTEMHPPIPYDELVLGRWDGLPGPGAHRFTYTMLKERCIEQLLRDNRSYRGERFLLLTGVRTAESKRRMGTAETVRRNGGQVWVNPLISWTNAEMLRYRQHHQLPVNEVSANLHMSGECLCGAMADQGDDRAERELIRFFYPEFDRRLTALEDRCSAEGKTYCEWGVKRPDARRRADATGGDALFDPDDFSPLCASCEFRATV